MGARGRGGRGIQRRDCRRRPGAVRTMTRPPEAIILTHGHFDHVGSLERLLQLWDVPVYAHTLELPYLTGRSSYPPPDPLVGGGAMAWSSKLYPRGPIDLDGRAQALPDDHTVPGLPGWRWIHTPGHSPGHVSLVRESDTAVSRAMRSRRRGRNRSSPWRRSGRNCTAARVLHAGLVRGRPFGAGARGARPVRAGHGARHPDGPPATAHSAAAAGRPVRGRRDARPWPLSRQPRSQRRSRNRVAAAGSLPEGTGAPGRSGGTRHRGAARHAPSPAASETPRPRGPRSLTGRRNGPGRIGPGPQPSHR